MSDKPYRRRSRRVIAISDEEATTQVDEPQEQLSVTETRIKFQKERVLVLLREKLGIFTHVYTELNISRRTIERWRKSDKVFNEDVLDILTQQRSFVEDKLMGLIGDDHYKAIEFYLKCKGKSAHLPSDGWNPNNFTKEGDIKEITIDTPKANTDSSHVYVEDVEAVRDTVSDLAMNKALAKAMKATPDIFGGKKKKSKKKKKAKKAKKLKKVIEKRNSEGE